MSPVNFTVLTTHDLQEGQMESIARNFNSVFEKDLPAADFMRQYINTPLGFSWHSLMTAGNEVVGYVSAIPYHYSYFGKEKIFCYIGGLYIVKEFRANPVALYKMYSALRASMQEHGVSAALTVPNKNSHPYFIHALKWKQIGTLSYYALPLKLANITGKAKILNAGSALLSNGLLQLSRARAAISNVRYKQHNIYLPRTGIKDEMQRYGEMHTKRVSSKGSVYYRTMKEEGIKTTYLIDWCNTNGIRDLKSLNYAMKTIVSGDRPDLVLYIGPLRLKQSVLLKVPKAKEPRVLNFCVDILKDDVTESRMLDIDNWDFGLYNFDVR